MLKVLIADDEQLICSMINKMIDWEGRGLALAGMANNGLDVLDQIRELHPDIVITDIRMPGLTGLELIEEAMKIDESLDFIIISGYKNFDYAHQALTMGVRHYLLKPIDRTELMETLDRIIEERRKPDSISSILSCRTVEWKLRTERRRIRAVRKSVLRFTGKDTGRFL